MLPFVLGFIQGYVGLYMVLLLGDVVSVSMRVFPRPLPITKILTFCVFGGFVLMLHVCVAVVGFDVFQIRRDTGGGLFGLGFIASIFSLALVPALEVWIRSRRGK